MRLSGGVRAGAVAEFRQDSSGSLARRKSSSAESAKTHVPGSGALKASKNSGDPPFENVLPSPGAEH
jgi:hypothetical protein